MDVFIDWLSRPLDGFVLLPTLLLAAPALVFRFFSGKEAFRSKPTFRQMERATDIALLSAFAVLGMWMAAGELVSPDRAVERLNDCELSTLDQIAKEGGPTRMSHVRFSRNLCRPVPGASS
jgi:hypothetical protein